MTGDPQGGLPGGGLVLGGELAGEDLLGDLRGDDLDGSFGEEGQLPGRELDGEPDQVDLEPGEDLAIEVVGQVAEGVGDDPRLVEGDLAVRQRGAGVGPAGQCGGEGRVAPGSGGSDAGLGGQPARDRPVTLLGGDVVLAIRSGRQAGSARCSPPTSTGLNHRRSSCS